MWRRTRWSLTSDHFEDFFGQELQAAGIAPVLRAVRQHLDMDVAFVARFRDDDRVFEYVDAKTTSPIQPGQAVPLEQGYCLRVVLGQLPQLIPDTSLIPAAMALPETGLIPIGAHLSVPIVLKSGRLYGTLCCFSYQAKPHLDKTDLRMLGGFASVLTAQLKTVQPSPVIQDFGHAGQPGLATDTLNAR